MQPSELMKKQSLISLKRLYRNGQTPTILVYTNLSASGTPVKANRKDKQSKKKHRRGCLRTSERYPRSRCCEEGIPELRLNKKERSLLENPTGWLLDNSMEVAKTLLKEQFPVVTGLCTVVLSWHRLH